MEKTRFKLRKVATIVVCLAVTVMFASCEREKTVKGSGNIVSQERAASGFSGIAIDGVADVNVHIDEDYKVVVTTDDNLQNVVLTEVKNNVLHINEKPKTSFNTATKVIVDVYLPELKNIDLKGVGTVILSDGNASDFKISLSGVGNIDAQNYQVEHIIITHSGVGEAKIWATNSLKGSLSGVGKIFYKGNPTIEVNVSGVGKIIRYE